MAKNSLRRQLDSIGFASFLILLGVLWLQPEGPNIPANTGQ